MLAQLEAKGGNLALLAKLAMLRPDPQAPDRAGSKTARTIESIFSVLQASGARPLTFRARRRSRRPSAPARA
jgi:hypothetical protein